MIEHMNHISDYWIMLSFLEQNKTTKQYLFLSSATFKKTAEFANNLFRVFPLKCIHEVVIFLICFISFGRLGFASYHKYKLKYFVFSILGMSLYIIKSQSLRKVKRHLYMFKWILPLLGNYRLFLKIKESSNPSVYNVPHGLSLP